jgi:hypothetical protein
MALVLTCPLCEQPLRPGYGECLCGQNRVHPFNQREGGGGVLVLFEKHQVWLWHDERPVWVLHYERPPEKRLRRRRRR